MSRDCSLDIAITGIAARLPGAGDLEAFWNGVMAGKSLIRNFDGSELQGLGIPEALQSNTRFVAAGGYLENSLRFDNEFFRVSARDAELTDPQYRIMLEVSWQALEDAGSARSDHRPNTGVFASGSSSGYMRALLATGALDEDALDVAIHGCEPDFIATNVAYRLGLTGQSMAVQTACSSSLVALHVASQALLNHEIDQALVVGSSIPYPRGGYLHLEGGIRSRTGCCLPFDQKADGVVPGAGVVAVVLRRRREAEEERLSPYGILLGSAINNDGNRKIGYMAPSVEGQTEVISRALAAANIASDTICYLEAHGTGTAIGDPLEWLAASQAYTRHGARPGQIAVGSAKANIGHLDGASGLAGLIKVLMMMKHGKIPPMAGFTGLNTLLEDQDSPLHVPTCAIPLSVEEVYRVGISSFGVGGTNCHVIVENVPRSVSKRNDAHPTESRFVVLSAKDEPALDRASLQLAAYLRASPDLELTDVARTLGSYRVTHSYRKAIWAKTTSELFEALTEGNSVVNGHAVPNVRSPLVFAFPGQGNQYPGMGLPWKEGLPGFKHHVQSILRGFSPAVAALVERALYDLSFDPDRLNRTELAQPALFALCVAANAALLDLGIQPDALIGHSFGELVALVAAKVISPKDGARLAEARGRMMQASPAGAMLAINCSSQELFDHSGVDLSDVSITAYNSPGSVTIGGSPDSIQRVAADLALAAIPYIAIPTACAFHTSSMAEPAQVLETLLSEVELHGACVPVARNLDGMIISTGQMPKRRDISKQALEPVRFDAGIHSLLETFPLAQAVEVGPGNAIASLCQANGMRAISLSGRRGSQHADIIRRGLSRLWVSGHAPALTDKFCNQGSFIRLPGYPFLGREFVHPSLAQAKFLSPPYAVAMTPDLDQVVADTGDVSRVLVGTWHKFLGVRDVGPDADFFDLGGDSLSVVGMAAKLRQSLGVPIEARELLANPVFKDQVLLLEERARHR